MIVRKLYTIRPDGVSLYITYSDANVRIRQEQTGAIYDAAIDVEDAPYTYTETDEELEEPVDTDPPAEPTITADEALNIILGEG